MRRGKDTCKLNVDYLIFHDVICNPLPVGTIIKYISALRFGYDDILIKFAFSKSSELVITRISGIFTSYDKAVVMMITRSFYDKGFVSCAAVLLIKVL